MIQRNAIEIDDLVKRFGDVTAVDGLSLEIREGEIFGLLGPNGAGKSTTINILSGLIEPTSDSAIVGGYDITKQPGKVRAHASRIILHLKYSWVRTDLNK